MCAGCPLYLAVYLVGCTQSQSSVIRILLHFYEFLSFHCCDCVCECVCARLCVCVFVVLISTDTTSSSSWSTSGRVVCCTLENRYKFAFFFSSSHCNFPFVFLDFSICRFSDLPIYPTIFMFLVCLLLFEGHAVHLSACQLVWASLRINIIYVFAQQLIGDRNSICLP